jgi:hypothetical protein
MAPATLEQLRQYARLRGETVLYTITHRSVTSNAMVNFKTYHIGQAIRDLRYQGITKFSVASEPRTDL